MWHFLRVNVGGVDLDWFTSSGSNYRVCPIDPPVASLVSRPRSRSRDSGDENEPIQERFFRPHFLQAPGDLTVQEGKLCRMDCKVSASVCARTRHFVHARGISLCLSRGVQDDPSSGETDSVFIYSNVLYSDLNFRKSLSLTPLPSQPTPFYSNNKCDESPIDSSHP